MLFEDLYSKHDALENDIIKALDENRTVIIESGSANDSILSYDITYGEVYSYIGTGFKRRKVTFNTTNCIFPKEICLEDYEEADLEIWNDAYFVQV